MYRDREEIWVKLTGDGPYGLRLGGAGTRWDPLVVAKLHKKSKARAAGVRVGDIVLSINGRSCDGVMTLKTASDLVDFSRDLNLQLLRSSSDQILLDGSTSFRQHPIPPSSRSHTSSPFLSDAEPAPSSSFSVQRHQSHSTELFRHKVSSYQTSPLTSADRGQQHGEPAHEVGGAGEEDARWQREDGREEKGLGGFSGRWQPGQSTAESGAAIFGRTTILETKWKPKVSDVPEIQLSEWNGEAVDSIPSHPLKLAKQEEFTPPKALPSFSTRAKPDRWQPPSSSQPQGEATTETASLTLKSSSNRCPADALVHEVVIWSSKPAEFEKPHVDFPGDRKSLPWQPKGSSAEPFGADEAETPVGWKPSSHGNQPKPSTWQPSESSVVESTGPKEQPSLWQPSSELHRGPTSEPSTRHRWQPTQSTVDSTDGKVSRGPDEQTVLDEPNRASQEDRKSPGVTSLFLRRVVTDGSALLAGSDAAETALPTGKTKLYADSSFYEDLEHTYPTIEEQIKMARKVAFLLTSPSNMNARGQRMFLKRKEQSTRWVIDPLNLVLPPLIITPPAKERDRKSLSPVAVERMRLHGDKSLHDVIPFDVCSMLAAELREEKGRGGRMFSKRRTQADKSITPDINSLIRVPETPIFHQEQNRKYVPTSDRKCVTETIARIPPPPPSVVYQPRDQVDARSDFELPVNRLKGMIDPPRAKITPWDSAVEYGTVDPAFEHLQGYRPCRSAPHEAETVRLSSGSLLNQGGRSEMVSKGHILDQQTPFYKRDQVISDNRSSILGSRSHPHSTGFVQNVDSSNFIRQAPPPSVDRKGYGPVRFQVGARNFN